MMGPGLGAISRSGCATPFCSIDERIDGCSFPQLPRLVPPSSVPTACARFLSPAHNQATTLSSPFLLAPSPSRHTCRDPRTPYGSPVRFCKHLRFPFISIPRLSSHHSLQQHRMLPYLRLRPPSPGLSLREGTLPVHRVFLPWLVLPCFSLSLLSIHTDRV
jgi:hypothetical protein